MELKKKKKIVIVTSGQPSLNPRLVKEADALTDAGYSVTVLYAYWNTWGKKLDKRLLATRQWRAICIGGDPEFDSSTYFLSRLIHRSAKFLIQKFDFMGKIAELAISRSSFSLIQTVKKYKADLYIAHNLAALPAVIKAASKYRAKTGFDAEDYHRQEISDDTNSYNYKITKALEDQYMPQTNYITASSPQITEAYSKVYPQLKPITILNVFSMNSAINTPKQSKVNPIRLFWFSQTIGISRGLNDIAKALKLLNADDFELHLLGYIPENNKQVFIEKELSGIKNVHFHTPVPQDELIGFASQFDIGLALEPGFCLNNNIALSNKLFTYLQAGLAIVASNTTAQKWFLDKHPQVGKSYQINDPFSLAAILNGFKSDIKKLSEDRVASLRLGRQELNWENEQKKFLNIIMQTLGSS